MSSKVGFFGKADGGTLFLDEIGDMSANLQPKLLRVLETGEYYPVGGRRLARSSVRLVCASNRDIPALTDLAHQLKGAAGSYGFRGITEAAHHLEATAKTQGDIEQTLAVLVALCRRVQPRQPAA